MAIFMKIGKIIYRGIRNYPRIREKLYAIRNDELYSLDGLRYLGLLNPEANIKFDVKILGHTVFNCSLENKLEFTLKIALSFWHDNA